jgi:glutamyl-tRNA reductase
MTTNRTQTETLTACCWPVASSSHDELAAVRAVAARHHDGAILDTCQRVEVYSVGLCRCDAPLRLHGADAAAHLAEVAAGLHSAVLGEAQVLGQVRRAFAEASPRLRRTADIALAASRELRRDAHFNEDSGHLLFRALQIGGTAPGGRLLVVGTGLLARLVARRGAALGFDEVIVTGRRAPEPEWLNQSGASFVRLAAVHSLAAVDVVAGCLGGDAEPLGREALPEIRGLVVDLGTPRNFAAGQVAPVVAIADILTTAACDPCRMKLVERLRAAFERHFAAAHDDRRSLLGAWRREIEVVRQREVSRTRRLHPELAPETVEAITRGLVNQLFHGPLKRLRHLDDQEFKERVVSLFETTPELEELGS